MKFFRNYPLISVEFPTGPVIMTNTTAHVRLIEKLKKNITVLYDYSIQDGERPDTVSQNLYGTTEYTWIILVLNQIFSLFDWPLQPDEFNNYIIERYGSVAAAQTQFVYQTFDGYRVDVDTWTDLDADQRLDPLSVYDDELNKNELKRRIKVVPDGFVTPLALELKKILSL
jgi:hypothetical protein